MLNIKKYVSLFLAVLLLLIHSFVSAEELPNEITFENSLYVESYSQTELTFTPADFPEVDCDRVVILYKEKYEDAYGSFFLVVLNQSGQKARAEATEKLKQLPFVSTVIENVFAEFQVTVDQTPIFVKKGESVTFEFSGGGDAWLFGNAFYGSFEVDPTVFDESTFTQDTFAHLGITKYWPLVSDSNTAMWNGETNLFPSPRHRYCTKVYFGNKGNGIEIADTLARTPGITMVGFFGSEIGGRVGYSIENNAPDVFEMDCQINYVSKPKFIAVTGKTVGQGMVSFDVANNVKATRDVFVYELGNVNEDTKIDAKDALLVLKYAVQKAELTQAQQKAAQVDGNEGITAKDALEILKYSVEKITKFPIEETVVTPTDVTPTNQ